MTACISSTHSSYLEVDLSGAQPEKVWLQLRNLVAQDDRQRRGNGNGRHRVVGVATELV